MIALETAALIASATPGTHLLGIVVQGLIIAFVAVAAASIGVEAGKLTDAFWQSVKDAKGDPAKIEAAAQNFARLVIYILRLLAEAVAGGVLAKISMKGIKNAVGDQIVAPRSVPDEGANSSKPSERHSPKKEPEKIDKPSTSPAAPEVVEVSVQRDQLAITESPPGGTAWTFKIEAPIPGQAPLVVARGYAKLDPQGLPMGGPEFTLNKRSAGGGKVSKVQIFEGTNPLSLTKVVLDEAVSRFKNRFGHEPNVLAGDLAWENLTNFQRAYVANVRKGMTHRAASINAAKQISFGAHRMARGYDTFEVTAEGMGEVNLGEPLGVQQAPHFVRIEARRSK